MAPRPTEEELRSALGGEALVAAVLASEETAIRALLRCGASINYRCSRRTMLGGIVTVGVQKQSFPSVPHCCRLRRDTGGSDQRLTSKAAGFTQVTPLIKAVQQGSEDVVRTLVQWRPRPPGLNTDPLDANAQVSPCTISPTHPPTHTPTHANRACTRAFHIARDCSHAPYSALPPMSKSADHSR